MADEFAAAGQWSILELLMRLTNHRPSSIVLIRPIKGLWLTLSHSRSEPLSPTPLCVCVPLRKSNKCQNACGKLI